MDGFVADNPRARRSRLARNKFIIYIYYKWNMLAIRNILKE